MIADIELYMLYFNSQEIKKQTKNELWGASNK